MNRKQDPTMLKVSKGLNSNHNETGLNVRRGIPLNHNETTLTVEKDIKVMTQDENRLKVRKASFLTTAKPR